MIFPWSIAEKSKRFRRCKTPRRLQGQEVLQVIANRFTDAAKLLGRLGQKPERGFL